MKILIGAQRVKTDDMAAFQQDLYQVFKNQMPFLLSYFQVSSGYQKQIRSQDRKFFLICYRDLQFIFTKRNQGPHFTFDYLEQYPIQENSYSISHGELL